MGDVADNWEDDDEVAEVAAPAPAAEEEAAPEGLSFNPNALSFNPNAGSFTPSWMGAPAAEAAPAADETAAPEAAAGEDAEVEAIGDDVVGLILTGADPVPEAQAPAEPAAPAEPRTMAEIEAVRNLHLFDAAKAEFWVVF